MAVNHRRANCHPPSTLPGLRAARDIRRVEETRRTGGGVVSDFGSLPSGPIVWPHTNLPGPVPRRASALLELDSTIEGPRHLTHLLGCRQVNTKITHISCLPMGMDGQRGAGDLRVAEALDGHQSPAAPFADDLEQTARLLRQISSL